jgi:uncharacterized protein (AIM24 family)
MSLKQVKINLVNNAVTSERGVLYFHKGNICAECDTEGVGGLAKKLIKNKLTNESAFTPIYSGNGNEACSSPRIFCHKRKWLKRDRNIYYFTSLKFF